MAPVDSGHILFVLGMHRSGTSALCAALHACGAGFSQDLIAPMAGVNDRGFWESASVVARNDELLHRIGASWYSITDAQLEQDWEAVDFAAERESIKQILLKEFGDAPVQVIKDPRLCITLPLWLSVCEELGLKSSVCVMLRDPHEVALSLERRDAFPLGYGLRLTALYLRGMLLAQPTPAFQVNYQDLLHDTVQQMRGFARHLPLSVDEESLSAAVDVALRHHRAASVDAPVSALEYCADGLADLQREIESRYPPGEVMARMVENLVVRGREISRIGEAHSLALQTMDERDAELQRRAEQLSTQAAEIERIGTLHTHAQSVVSEREAQLRALQAEHEEIGRLHGHALTTIEERDAQLVERDAHIVELDNAWSEASEKLGHANEVLEEIEKAHQRIFNMPIIGRMFRAVWNLERS